MVKQGPPKELWIKSFFEAFDVGSIPTFPAKLRFNVLKFWKNENIKKDSKDSSLV